VGRIILAVWIGFCYSNYYCHGAQREIRLPPFAQQNRKGCYDAEVKRTEYLNRTPEAPIEWVYHVEVTDTGIRVVTRQFSLAPGYKEERIYSPIEGSILTISTVTGKENPRVEYTRDVTDEAEFYSGFHGINVINGCFWNAKGSVWDAIRERMLEAAESKLVLPGGIEVDLSPRDDYLLLEQLRLQAQKSQMRLYTPKFYRIKPPSTNPVSSTEELRCTYGADEREQKYRYRLGCSYDRASDAGIRLEITVHNRGPVVGIPPLSDNGVYGPTLVPVPNGTDVGVVNGGQVDYMWQDGRIVKRVDGTAINAANSVVFKRRSRAIWLTAVLAGVVLLIAARLWFRKKGAG
jgi:hypothetical protein